jgi:hypothetical protein
MPVIFFQPVVDTRWQKNPLLGSGHRWQKNPLLGTRWQKKPVGTRWHPLAPVGIRWQKTRWRHPLKASADTPIFKTLIRASFSPIFKISINHGVTIADF